MRYTVFSRYSRAELQDIVNEYLNTGDWELVGGVDVGGPEGDAPQCWTQALRRVSNKGNLNAQSAASANIISTQALCQSLCSVISASRHLVGVDWEKVMECVNKAIADQRASD